MNTCVLYTRNYGVNITKFFLEWYRQNRQLFLVVTGIDSFASAVYTWSDKLEYNYSHWVVFEKCLKGDCLTHHEHQLQGCPTVAMLHQLVTEALKHATIFEAPIKICGTPWTIVCAPGLQNLTLLNFQLNIYHNILLGLCYLHTY